MADKPQHWHCPFCGTFTTLNIGDQVVGSQKLNGRSKHGDLTGYFISTACPNPSCNELALTVMVWTVANPNRKPTSLLNKGLWPEANVMPLPDFIPPSIAKTYREACLVAPISGPLRQHCPGGVCKVSCATSATSRSTGEVSLGRSWRL